MRRFIAVFAFLVLSFGGLSSSATAATGSAVDQYSENIPSGAGSKGLKGSGGGEGTKPLGSKQAKSLAKHGEDGQQLEQVLRTASGAPAPEAAAGGATGSAGGGSEASGSGLGSGSGTTGAAGTTPPATAPDATGKSGGDGTTRSAVTAGLASDLGPVPLWVALVAVLVVAAGVAVARRARA